MIRPSVQRVYRIDVWVPPAQSPVSGEGFWALVPGGEFGQFDDAYPWYNYALEQGLTVRLVEVEHTQLAP